ncbi:homoserine O-succinyltransferase [Vagococcus acidifermentans]|uniref:Homoserine O-acetyltransferase n=1 Tax=Vagococcus acidifermentans TaxID=564710 RepID=A0A430AVT0_9ENTE|nr:homoserine O-succinyltransferase [Vagococcus acidifermentans]RSU12158.1 homoserine O-succinyltransferase [Vagococcus acidifermentans]
MPIKLMNDFPAKEILEREDIFAIDNQRASTQDIRPLKLLILNLMPNKIDTETQLLRLISQSPLQIDVDFLKIASHQHKNTSIHHLSKFYLDYPDVADRTYDGMIITGAPVEHLPFHQVTYWDELKVIMDWSQTNVTSVIHICWGAQAALFHHYGIDKVAYEKKLFGVFPQYALASHRLLRGFDDVFEAPQSRYTGIDEAQIDGKIIQVIAHGEGIGATMLVSQDNHNIFLLGHLEYDTDSLKNEYLRDRDKGLGTALPENYFADDKADGVIRNRWRGHAHLLYHNWLNDVYQLTPYRLADIPAYNAQKRLKNHD